MKRRTIASIIITASVFFFIAGSAAAAPTSTTVQNLIITGVKNAPCLTTDGGGLVGSTNCGSGGGGTFTTTTINGQAALVFHLIGDATTVTSTTSGATTTFSVIPGVYLTPASGTAQFYPISGNPSGFSTTTIQAVLNALSASGCLTYSTSTGQFGGSCISSSTGNTLYLQIGNNLSDLTSTSSARANLGYSAAPPIVLSSTGTISLSLNSGATESCSAGGFFNSLTSIGTAGCGNAIISLNGMSKVNENVVGGSGFLTTTSSDVMGTHATTTINLATTTVSQWINDVPYVSVASGTALYYPLNSNPAGYVTSTVAGGVSTSSSNTWSALQTFTAGISTASATLPYTNASGTFSYSISNDGNYIEINDTTGTIPGTSPVPYNIVLQNCPPVSTTSTLVTSSSWECALSQAENFPDGSRSFVDWDTEYYPTGTSPNIASGWFDNKRGTSSVEFPFELSWNDGAVNHVGFSMTPATNTSASNFNTLDNNGTGYFTVGTASSTTGAFDVFQNGGNTCAGIYDSGASTIYGLTDSLPAPAGCTALGGYYHGLAVGGNSSGTGTPIFGVLNSSQSSNGRGHTTFTCYDTNECDTFNNELDSGGTAGNALIKGTMNASGTITQAGVPVLTANQPITVTATGDATGSATGTTSISIPLVLKPQIASTTIGPANYYDATTTSPYNQFTLTSADYMLTISSFSCQTQSATTTYHLIRTTSTVNTTGQAVADITCGAAVNTITSFTTSTISTGTFLRGVVSSTTEGLGDLDTLWGNGFKN